MTARSKGRRMKNQQIKQVKSKVKELKRLRRTVLGKDAAELLETMGDVVDHKTVEELKLKQAEKLIEQEFIQEKQREIAGPKKQKKNLKTMKVVNSNTGVEHNFNTKTLKDEYNSYPPWLNVGNHKRKIKRRKTAIKKNQFYTGAILE